MLDIGPTLADRLIPFYVRFLWGFGYISIILGLISFGMNLITMITVKGFYIPLWLIPLVAMGVILFCTAIGYYFEKHDVQNRISSHSNKKANPELNKIMDELARVDETTLEIKRLLERHR